MTQAVQGTGQCPAEKPRLALSLRKRVGHDMSPVLPCGTRKFIILLTMNGDYSIQLSILIPSTLLK